MRKERDREDREDAKGVRGLEEEVMREIKFKAWFTNGKFKTLEGQKCSMQDERTLLEFLQDVKDCADEYGYNFILMQFTGLRDKNGKEIYEGDIVQPVTMNDSNLNLWNMVNGQAVKKQIEIKWDDKYAQFEIQLPTTDLEVIGNIYENPELLK